MVNRTRFGCTNPSYLLSSNFEEDGERVGIGHFKLSPCGRQANHRDSINPNSGTEDLIWNRQLSRVMGSDRVGSDRHVIQDNLFSWIALGDEYSVQIELKRDIGSILDLEDSGWRDGVVIAFSEGTCRAG